MKKNKQDKSIAQDFSVVDEDAGPEVDVDAIVKEANDYADGEVAKVKLQLDEATGRVSELSLEFDAVNALIASITAQTSDHEFDIENLRKFNENMAGGMGIVVENGQFSLEEAKKWQFERLSTTSIKVGVGSIIRNDTPVTSAVTDITGCSSAGTYYILATLSRAAGTAYNPRLIPDTVTVTKSAVNTWPSVDTAGTLIYVLGEVVVNSDGVISDFTQYISDDIHDWQDVPDGQRHVATNPSTRTLNRNPTDNVHKLELEMYGAEVATLAGGQTWVNKHALPVLIKDVNLSGDLEWFGLDSENDAKSLGLSDADLLELYEFHDNTNSVLIDGSVTYPRAGRHMLVRDTTTAPDELIYCDLATFKAYSADRADSAAKADDITDHHVILHSELGDISAYIAGDDHQYPNYSYISNTGDADRNNMGEGSGIGDHLGKLSLSPDLRILYGDNGTAESVNWNSRILYDDDGTTPVLKYDLDDWLLYFGATNKWDADDFIVKVTDDASITVADDFDLSVASVAEIYPASNGTGVIAIGGGTHGNWGIACLRGGTVSVIADELYLGGSTAIYHQGNPGTEIFGYLSGGAITNPNMAVYEIKAYSATHGEEKNFYMLGVLV